MAGGIPLTVDPEQDRAEVTPKRRVSYGPSVLVALAFVLFAARLFRLISQYAVNIFFSDQWDFNDATLFQKHSLWQMFAWQHGPHRQGLAALFAKLIEPQFRWNSRTESFVVGAVIVAAAICALYLKKRLYGDFSIFDMLIPALIFVPAQYEAVFVTANFAHGPFPLLLVLLYCLAWTYKSSIRYPLVLIINYLAIYTGFGVFVGLLTPMLLIMDYRADASEQRPPMTYFVVAIVVSLLSLGSFFIDYTLRPASDNFSLQPVAPKHYLYYMALMFANFFTLKGIGLVQLAVGLGVLIVLSVSLAAATWRLLQRYNLNLPQARQKVPLITAALIAYCLLFCLSTAYGRVSDGWWTARASRYVIYLEAGMLGLYFHALSIRHERARTLLLVGLFGVVLGASSYVDRTDMAYFFNIKQSWKRCYFVMEDAITCDEIVGFPIYTHAGEGTRLQEKLDYLKATRQNLYADPK